METKGEGVSGCVKAYRYVAKIPVIESGRILSGSIGEDFVKVTSVWKQRNIELGKFTKFQKVFVVNVSSSEVVFDSPPCEMSTVEMSRGSNSETQECVIRKVKAGDKKKQLIEIWSLGALTKTFDVNAIEAHGDVYCDGEFGCLEWSAHDEKVLYVAEKKRKKPEPFYRQKSVDSKPDDRSVQGEEYLYRPDWGEDLVDKHQTVVAICDLKTDALLTMKGFPANFSPGQVLWSKDSTGIFGVVYDSDPRRLGLLHCTNRAGFIFSMSLNGDFKILSDPNKSVRSPRLSPDGKNLFWLQRQAGGPHDGCHELMKLDLAQHKREVVIEITRSPGKTFSGMFLNELPRRCFSGDGTKLFFSSIHKFKICSYYIDLVTKEIVPLEIGDGSSKILDVRGDILLFSVDSLQINPSLKIMKLTQDMESISLTESDVICPHSTFKEMEFQSKTGKHKFVYFNALYYGPSPKISQKIPLVLYLHGGPHAAFINSYSIEPNFLVKCGYGVLMVNYRGSTGVGQEGVEFLLGKIGDTDVRDSYEAMQQTLKTFSYLDEKNVFLFGGSHGGFLVQHLNALFPDAFRAAATRNPVTNIFAMYHMSDIPDWTMHETGQSFDETKPVTQDVLQKLYNASPISVFDKIRTPTLFLLGKNDKRVPYYEGIKMYNCLRARRVKVRLNLYEDNHSLGEVPHHIDSLINAVLWFHENRSG